jgi:hypothetical protein
LAGIEAFMIIPVQRIPRYRLLFEELLKHTPPNDPDYHSLNQSLSKIVDMAKENNDAIKAQENKRAIIDVMLSIEIKSRVNLLNNPKRRLIKSGTMRKDTSKGMREYMFWLFTDKILYGELLTGMGFSYALSREIYLTHVRTADGPTDNSFLFESTAKSFVAYTK